MVETDRGDGSASFDAAGYHREIVRPCRGDSQRLPSDLRVRYDIRGPLSERALARHLDQVVGYWLQRCREHPDYSRPVYVALLEAHGRLLNDPAIQLFSPAWWSAYRSPEPEAASEPAKPPLSDADPPTALADGPPPAQAPSDVMVEDGAVVDPPGATATASATNAAGDVPAADAPTTGMPAIDGRPASGAPADRARDLEVKRIGDDLELSWIWPTWATEALVSWDANSKLVDREEFRRTGHWRTTLTPDLSDGELTFSVAVRGAALDRRDWSEAVSVVIPGPRHEVLYTIRRRWSSFPARVYTVSFRTDRPPAQCDIMIAFSKADAFPETADSCEELGMVFMSFDKGTRFVTVPRRSSGWLCCFLVRGESIILKHPDIRTLRIRSWIR